MRMVLMILFSWAAIAQGEQSILVNSSSDVVPQPIAEQPVAAQPSPQMQQAYTTVYQPVYGVAAYPRCGPIRRGLWGPYRYRPYYAGSIGYQVPLYQWQLNPVMIAR